MENDTAPDPVRLTARQAFKMVSPADDGGTDHTNYQRLERLKPTPEAARRLRILMGIPAGDRRPISINHWEYSSGDGYMADESEDTVTVSCGAVRYELTRDEPMGRLLARINNAHHDPAAQAADLLAGPAQHDGSRWAVVEYDTGHEGLERIAGFRGSDTLTLGTPAFTWEAGFKGPGKIIVRVDRDAAAAQYPCLNYAGPRFAAAREREIFQTAFAAWKRGQDGPVMGNFRYTATDLTEVADELYVNISGLDRTTFEIIRDWCQAEPCPLNADDDELLDMVAAMLFVTAQQERDLTPHTDHGIDFFTPLAVREVLRLIWSDFL